MAFNLKEHLEHEHRVSSLSEFLEEIVYGAIDGIITTFAVVAGYAGAGGKIDTTTTAISALLFGLANLFADGASMGLGNFLSSRSARDVYNTHRKKEEHEIAHHTKAEGIESIEILKQEGFSNEDAKTLVDIYKRNPSYWADFMMYYELKIPDLRGEEPYKKGLVTFFSFIVFGAIPLIPYITNFFYCSTYTCTALANNELLISAIFFTSIALLGLSIIRWYATKINIIRSTIETFSVGIVSGAIAYGVGVLFEKFILN